MVNDSAETSHGLGSGRSLCEYTTKLMAFLDKGYKHDKFGNKVIHGDLNGISLILIEFPGCSATKIRPHDRNSGWVIIEFCTALHRSHMTISRAFLTNPWNREDNRSKSADRLIKHK